MPGRCRVCLSESPGSPLFEDGRAERLARCTGLTVKRDDALPAIICDGCSADLEVSYNFRLIAERSHAVLLREELTLRNSKCEPTPKPSTGVNVLDVRNLKNEFLSNEVEPQNAPLIARIYKQLSKDGRTDFTLNDTVIMKAQAREYDLRVEYDEDISPMELQTIPMDSYDHDLVHSFIKVHDFETYVERRMLREKKEIKIVSGRVTDTADRVFESQRDTETIEIVKEEDQELAYFQITDGDGHVQHAIVPPYLQNVDSYVGESPGNFYSICETVDDVSLTSDDKFAVPSRTVRVMEVENSIVNTDQPIVIEGTIVRRKDEPIIVKQQFVREKHVCPICGILTYGIGAHMLTHQDNRPFVCQECNKTFAQKCYYEAHMKKHSGIKDNICEICGAAYYFTKSLMRHKLVHKGDKPFCCDKCPMKFYVKCDLVRHLKVHAGYKPFSCTICLMTFNAKHQLKNHVRMHTGEKPFTCEVCDVAFTYKVNLNNHCVKAHNVDIKFKSIHAVTAEVLRNQARPSDADSVLDTEDRERPTLERPFEQYYRPKRK